MTGLTPARKQHLSERSDGNPLDGQATGPCRPWVVAFWQTPVVGLHGPSPVVPSLPPLHVWKTRGSTSEEPSEKMTEKKSLLLTDAQNSLCPISYCMSTPASSAAHSTWFCFFAVLYSTRKLCGVPEQSIMLVF